jgi:hypothetical protein
MAYIQTVYNTGDYRFRLTASEMKFELVKGRRFSILTAANPFSRQFSDDENAVRNQSMKLELEKLGFEFDWSYGEQSDHCWREDGFIVFDAPLAVMLELAQKFEQNAILHGVDSKVALAWCDNEELEWFFARPELD